jgi:hypothetical protein
VKLLSALWAGGDRTVGGSNPPGPATLGNFCRTHRLTPKGLAGMGEDRVRDLLMDFVAREEKRGARVARGVGFKSAQVWLSHDRRPVDFKTKIKGAGAIGV